MKTNLIRPQAWACPLLLALCGTMWVTPAPARDHDDDNGSHKRGFFSRLFGGGHRHHEAPPPIAGETRTIERTYTVVYPDGRRVQYSDAPPVREEIAPDVIAPDGPRRPIIREPMDSEPRGGLRMPEPRPRVAVRDEVEDEPRGGLRVPPGASADSPPPPTNTLPKREVPLKRESTSANRPRPEATETEDAPRPVKDEKPQKAVSHEVVTTTQPHTDRIASTTTDVPKTKRTPPSSKEATSTRSPASSNLAAGAPETYYSQESKESTVKESTPEKPTPADKGAADAIPGDPAPGTMRATHGPAAPAPKAPVTAETKSSPPQVKPDQPANLPPSHDAPKAATPTGKDYPLATRTQKPGFVKSPYQPFNELDATEMNSGSLARDPTTGKIFRVP